MHFYLLSMMLWTPRLYCLMSCLSSSCEASLLCTRCHCCVISLLNICIMELLIGSRCEEEHCFQALIRDWSARLQFFQESCLRFAQCRLMGKALHVRIDAYG